MCNVVPIKPTVGMSNLDQLRAFVAFEQESMPEKTHIAAWALLEIERLRAAIQQTLDENGHLADGENCTLIVLKRALDVPKPNFVFLSGESNPLNLDASERRFMVVMDDVEQSNEQN